MSKVVWLILLFAGGLVYGGVSAGTKVEDLPPSSPPGPQEKQNLCDLIDCITDPDLKKAATTAKPNAYIATSMQIATAVAAAGGTPEQQAKLANSSFTCRNPTTGAGTITVMRYQDLDGTLIRNKAIVMEEFLHREQRYEAGLGGGAGLQPAAVKKGLTLLNLAYLEIQAKIKVQGLIEADGHGFVIEQVMLKKELQSHVKVYVKQLCAIPDWKANAAANGVSFGSLQNDALDKFLTCKAKGTAFVGGS